jgi:transcription antitermination factor NusG
MLSDTYKDVRFAALKRGDAIVVEEGAFKGQSATFKEQKGNKTILILNGLGTKLILEK